MKQTDKQPNSANQFVGYEDARTSKGKQETQPATTKAIKAALNRINPDENNQERG